MFTLLLIGQLQSAFAAQPDSAQSDAPPEQSVVTSTAETGRNGPNPDRMLQDGRHLSSGTISATIHAGYWVWRNVVSPGDGPRCPMRPTCSAYARDSFSTYGPLGFVTTFDRLLRDGNTEGFERAPDGLHFLDPLDDHPPPGPLLTGTYCKRQRDAGAEACL